MLHSPNGRPLSLSRLDLALCVLLFVLLLTLYIQTAGPSLGGLFDSEEYQWTAYALDFAPSTGYPLYLLLGKLWIALFPIGSVAYRMNLLSGLFAALASAVLYLDCYVLTRNRIAALVGALWFGTSSSFWFQASVASVSPLHVLLLGLIILSLFLWAAGRAPLESVALLIGLSLAHHRSTLLILPAVVGFVWLNAPDIWRSPRRLIRPLLIGAAPLLLYIYIPFTADPAVDRSYIINQILNGGSTFNSQEQQLLYLKEEITYLWQWLWVPGTILVAVGLVAALFKRDGFSLPRLPVSIFLLLSAFPLAVMPIFWFLELERYTTVVFFLLIFWVTAGINILLRAGWWRSSSLALRVGRVSAVLLVAGWLAFSLPSNLAAAKAGTNDKEYGLWNEIMALPLEDRAEILVNWSELNAMRYMQVVEGRRQDLTPVRIDQDVSLEQAEIDAALERGQPVYLTPSAPEVPGAYHYSALGPLVRVNSSMLLAAPHSPVTVATQSTPPIALVGFGLSRSLQAEPPSAESTIPAGSTVRLELVWRANSNPDADYQLRLRLVDDRNHLWAQSKERPVRGRYPTSLWQANEIIPDSHGLLIPTGTPPGQYRIMIDWLDATSGALQPVTGGTPIVTVENTHSPVEQVFVRRRVNAIFGNLVSLVGVNSPAQLGPPGDKFSAALVWRAQTDLRDEYAVDFRLTDASASTVAEWKDLPLVSTLPTNRWRQGDTYQEFYDFDLSPGLSPNLSMHLSVVDKSGHRLSVRSGSNPSQALSFLDQFGLRLDLPIRGSLPDEIVLFSSASR